LASQVLRRMGVELRTTRRAVTATLSGYVHAREQPVPAPLAALGEATAEILRRLQAIEDHLAS
jgi:uroporphyrinogen-III synthase